MPTSSAVPLRLDPPPGSPRISALLAAAAATLDGPDPVLALPQVRAAIVMLVDGLGAALLRRRRGHARHLARRWDEDRVGFSFPSTTVAGITSLTTATDAGEHGLISASVYDHDAHTTRNLLNGWEGDDRRRGHRDRRGESAPAAVPEQWQRVPTVFERRRAAGAESWAVAPAAFAASGFTRATLRGARFVAADPLADRCAAAARAVRRGDHALVYLYHGTLDEVGHDRGLASDDWIGALEALDAEVAALERALPGDVGLLVVADHGMVDTDDAGFREIPEHLLAGVEAVAGEPRLLHCYLDADARGDAAQVAARIADEYPDAVVRTGEAALAHGWYGPHPGAACRSRIGDVLVAATGTTSFAAPSRGMRRTSMIGQHGSITDTETAIPILTLGAFADE